MLKAVILFIATVSAASTRLPVDEAVDRIDKTFEIKVDDQDSEATVETVEESDENSVLSDVSKTQAGEASNVFLLPSFSPSNYGYNKASTIISPISEAFSPVVDAVSPIKDALHIPPQETLSALGSEAKKLLSAKATLAAPFVKLGAAVAEPFVRAGSKVVALIIRGGVVVGAKVLKIGAGKKIVKFGKKFLPLKAATSLLLKKPLAVANVGVTGVKNFVGQENSKYLRLVQETERNLQKLKSVLQHGLVSPAVVNAQLPVRIPEPGNAFVNLDGGVQLAADVNSIDLDENQIFAVDENAETQVVDEKLDNTDDEPDARDSQSGAIFY